MLAGSWYFFCLIMVSSYTANLAAFLTVETVERPIKNAEDLANQNIIQYGAKRGGSTLGFFKDSNSTTYSKMYQYMMNNEKEVLTADNDAGKKKVLNENYAFLMESSSIEYIQERECNLTQIGGLLDQKGYGIAMKKNQYFVNLTNAQIPIEMKEFADEGLKFNIIFQPANSYLCPMMNCCNTIEIHNNWLPLNLLWDASYRNELSRAVLKLQEMGILTALKSKWWKEKGGHCQEDSGGGQAEELGLANVGGVFLVLIVGVTLSFFGTIFEFFFSFVNIQQDKKVSLKDKLSREIMFIVNFGTSTKMIKDQQLK